VGTLVGQLLFGWLGDKFGRKPVFGLTLWMMVAFALGSGLSYNGSPTGVIATLCVMRFFLGVGIGGDYPLSATLMSEYSSRSRRGQFVAAVFAMQGMGILAAAVVTLAVSSIFNAIDGNPDNIWRLVLMFGAIPTAATMYARLHMPETPRYTLFVAQNNQGLVGDMSQVLAEDLGAKSSAATQQSVRVERLDTRGFLRQWGRVLFGCASTWFLLDIAFYSQNLFQADIFTAVGWLPPAYMMGPDEEAYLIARAQAIVALLSTIPGYWFTVFTIEKMGRFKIQVMGFAMMTLWMTILTIFYNPLKTNAIAAFIMFYALTFFFANWGPNATTFVIPAEVFPSAWRSTAHGMAAAAGKAGAIIGTFGFGVAKNDIGVQASLAIMCGINALGLLCTSFVPETKGKSLEELSADRVVTAPSPKDRIGAAAAVSFAFDTDKPGSNSRQEDLEDPHVHLARGRQLNGFVEMTESPATNHH